MNYDVKECLLSPIQFGIPNHRLRYYMMAHRRVDPQQKGGEGAEEGSTTVSVTGVEGEIHTKWPFTGEYQLEVPELCQFIENTANDDLQYRVPEKDIVKRHKFRFGILICFIFL